MENISTTTNTDEVKTMEDFSSIEYLINSSKLESGMFKNAKENKQVIDNFIEEAYKNFSFEIINKYFTKDFVKHRSWYSDGVNHAKELYMFNFKYTPFRWAAQNNLVVYHGVYQLTDNLNELSIYAVDIWKIEDGKIAEHWNVVELIPFQKKDFVLGGLGDGNGFLDRDNVLFKMGLISSFSHLAYLGYNFERLHEYVNEDFVFHHRDKLMNYRDFNQYFSSLDVYHFENKKMIASGDLIFAYNYMQINSLEKMNVDIFRMDNTDKISEMWSINQGIIAKADKNKKIGKL